MPRLAKKSSFPCRTKYFRIKSIERSKNGKYYTEIGEVAGAGNSQKHLTYSFIDESPLSENYYRLRQVDFDGQTETSNSILGRKICKDGLHIQLMPNITNYLTMIQLAGGEEDTIVVELNTRNGRLIKAFSIIHDGEATQSPLNVTFLPEGV